MVQRHDLSRVKSTSDVYGEDKRCRVLPTESEIFELNPGGSAAVNVFPVDIHFPRGTAVTVGDIVEVKKTRVRSGAREAVTANLLADASSGDTTIYIDDAVGFESGDEITISDGTNAQRFIVKSVTDNTMVLFTALAYSFLTGADLEADTFYKIQTMRVPGSVGPVIQTTAIESFYTGYDA